MQRYFVPESDWDNMNITIRGDDAHHINRVIRSKEGDRVICNHPNGKAAICEIFEIASSEIHLKIQEWLEKSAELPVDVTISQGLPKGDKFDLIVQKGTELGAHSFIPFNAERSVVVWDDKKMDKKMKRFAKIVKEASEQSHRNRIPRIMPMMTLSELIEESSSYDVKIFPYEEEARSDHHKSLGKIVNGLESGQKLLICIGPEGGFSANEASELTKNGFSPVRLGPRILRTETAALYVLASISYHLEELGCN